MNVDRLASTTLSWQREPLSLVTGGDLLLTDPHLPADWLQVQIA